MSVLNLSNDTYPTAEDSELISMISEGDSAALAELYERYSRIVYSTALRMLGSAELAEEVVQETFWRVWRRSNTFKTDRGRVSSWIIGIAHNLAIDELRRQRSRPVPVYDEDDKPSLLEVEDQRVDVSSKVLEHEQREMISLALAQIPQDQREAIELAYFGGLSQSEIAAKLQNPLGTVKTRMRLGMQKLRDILSSQGYKQTE